MMTSVSQNRRRFLQFLAASPLISKAWADELSPILNSPKDALKVMDFAETAHSKLPPA